MHNPLSASDVSIKKEILTSPIEPSEENIHSSELRYRRLFETAQDGILILDAKTGRIEDANPFVKELLGYSQTELAGKELWEIGVFKDINDSKAAFRQLQTKGYIRYKDLPLQTKGGTMIDVEFVSNVYAVGDQKVIQCNIRDITARRKAEEATMYRAQELERLTKSQEVTKKAMLNVMEDLETARALIEVEKVKDDAVLASIGEGLIAFNNERKIMVVNKAAEKMLGWDGKDLLGKDLTSLLLEDEEGVLVPLEKRPTSIALSTGQMVNNTYFFIKKDKTRFPVAITVTPIKLGETIIGAVDIFRDITREKEIDRAKSEFVSLASHQLRTPLGIAKWYIEAIRSEEYLETVPKIVKDYLEEVYKSNERLLSLVRDLLSVSRIDQGKIRNNPQEVDIVLLIKNIIKGMNIIAAKSNITIHLLLKTVEIPAIFIDPSRLQEVFENLIANAIVYSDSGGKVEIIVAIKNEFVRVAVNDKGIGISERDQKQLFTRFFRSEKAAIRNTEGSGLGLYVVKSYIDEWKGTIVVVSAEGKGSSFTIMLPLKMKNDQKDRIVKRG